MYEDGEWTCSLSKHRQLPDWLDDVAEAHHAMLPLAILAALVGARRSGLGSGQIGLPRVPRVRPWTKSLVALAAAAAVTVALMWIVIAILKFDVVAFLNDFN